MTEELKPCPNPWCASEVRVQKMVNPHTHKHRVICDLCELTGPYGTDEQEARQLWNTRAESDEVARLKARIAELEAIVDELDFEQCTHPDGLGIGVDFKGRPYCRLRDEA